MTIEQWTEPGFAGRAGAWIDEQLAVLGTPRTGPVEQVAMGPWSMVLRAPAAGSHVYFKANIPVLAHEPRLVRVIDAIRPGRVLPVLADDPDRGWMLAPEGGPTLRSAIATQDQVHLWEPVLASYAELQIATAEHVPVLLEAGAFDYRLEALDELYGRVLDGEPEMDAGPHGLTDEECAAIAQLRPRHRELCRELAGLGVPETLHHDDFHAANVLGTGADCRFCDWHEGCVSHPFISMQIALRVTQWRLELEDGAPELERMRDAYLEAWSGYASGGELRAGLDVALRVGRLTRALSWWTILANAGPAAQREDGTAVADWLRLLLEAL